METLVFLPIFPTAKGACHSVVSSSEVMHYGFIIQPHLPPPVSAGLWGLYAFSQTSARHDKEQILTADSLFNEQPLNINQDACTHHTNGLPVA